MGVAVTTAQELLRQANSRITLNLCARAVSADKRQASRKQIEMLMGGVSLPSPATVSFYATIGGGCNSFILDGFMASAAGFEPATSTV